MSFFKGTGPSAYAATPVVTASILPNGYTTIFVQPLDLSADGRADLVFQTSDNQFQNFYILLGGSDGTFTRAPDNPSGAAHLPATSQAPVGVPGKFSSTSAQTDLFLPIRVPGGPPGGYPTNEILWGVLFANPISSPPGLLATDSGWSAASRGTVVASAAVGDVNGDQKLDGIAIVNMQTLTGSPSAQVYIAYGNGDRTFQTGKNAVPGTQGATSVQATDVNADGKLDLIVGLPAGPTTFYGDGAGNFSTTAP